MNNPVPTLKRAVDSVSEDHVEDCGCNICDASENQADFIAMLPEAKSKQRAS